MTTSESMDAVFERLHAEYADRVYAWFRRQGFSAEESEDLRQDVFLRVRRKLKPGIGSQRGWLYSVVRTVWKNELRYRQADKRRAAEVSIDAEAEGPRPALRDGTGFGERACRDPLELQLAAERSRVLREAVEKLPERMRQCVRLSLAGEWPYREIARRLGISEQTVKSQMFHARNRLKEELDAYFAAAMKTLPGGDDDPPLR